MMLLRTKVWTLSLAVAAACSVGCIFIPGECVVEPVGSPDGFLRGSVFSTFVHPFAFGWVYVLNVLLKLSPIGLVVLALYHWQRRFDHLRAAAALYALGL